MTILLPVLAALVALTTLPGLFFSFDVAPKAAILLAGAAAALAFTRRLPPRYFALLLAGQAAAAILAAIFSVRPQLALEGAAWRKMGLPVELAILAFAWAVRPHIAGSSLRIFLRITVLAGFVPAIYGIAQYFGIDPWLPKEGYHFGQGEYQIVRPPSTLGHASYFATYLLYIIFGGIALARMETSRLARSAAIAASGIATIAIVLSGTRAGLVGLAAGALFAIIRERAAFRRWIPATAALLVIVGVFYFSPAGAKLRARAFWSGEDPRGGARFLLWRDSAALALERPVTGFGPETFSRVFASKQSIELARAYPDFFHESPHNIFLDALTERGVLGLAALVALAIYGIVHARGAIGAAFIAILVSQQFTVFTIPTALYFYTTLALLAKGSPEGREVRSFVRLPAALILILAAIRLAGGDLLLASARRSLDQSRLADALRSIDQARAWGAHADIFFSRRLLAYASDSRDPGEKLLAWQRAGESAERATRTADDPPNAWVNLAADRAIRNDAAGVGQALRSAIGASPHWYKPHWLLAQALALEGRKQEALDHIHRAINAGGDRHPEVRSTLASLSR